MLLLKDEKNKGLIFRVQILSLNTKIGADSYRLKGEPNTFEYQQGGLYKYCSKGFKDNIQDAISYKVEMREKGFKGAFVVAFLHGERISIEKARKLVKN